MQAILKFRMMGVWGPLLALLAAGLALQSAQAQSSNPSQKSENKASGSSQAHPASGSSTAAEKESASANKEHAGGPQEGIKVHGHWVIDVRSPDGKLVTHNEFENGYVGNSFLSRILARQNSVGLWKIDLRMAGGPTLSIVEFNDPDDAALSRNLVPSASGQTFALNGSLTAPQAGDIVSVLTLVTYCDPNTAPIAPCVSGTPESFTQTLRSVSVVSGATVQVTVTFTFN